MNPIPATANVRTFTLVKRADGDPITSGTVNSYVVALTGDNAGKWFQGSDQSWQAAEAIALAATHKGDGHWTASIHADCWIEGVRYMEYAKESGDLHVPLNRQTIALYPPGWSSAGKAPATLASGDVTGSISANLAQILGTAITEDAAGRLAASFKKFFDIATPLLTVAAAMRGTDSAAPAATALSTAEWTATRAGYLDKLNITGNVASSAEVTAIQNNTRVRVIVPPMMERPDAGSTDYVLHLYCYDEQGAMEAPDSTPTLTVENEEGTDRSGNLGSVTLEDTGHYSVTYTLASDAAIEQLLCEWTVTEGAVARLHGASAQIVDTTAVDFTDADRTKLTDVHNKLPSGNISDFDGTGATLATDAVSADALADAAIAEIVTAVWGAAARTLTAFAFTPSLHVAYDAAKTAGDGTAANQTDILEDLGEIAASIGALTSETPINLKISGKVITVT